MIESKLNGWDIDERVCVINAIQLTETIEIDIPEALEDVRG